ncbi:MAG: hypothetical protein OXG42_01535 [Chloroflexi bacterium]|nr:hypothetical protein [Chloroflexota bacterium]
MKLSCRSCFFFEAFPDTRATDAPKRGTCHRNPPAIMPTPAGFRAHWPVVHTTDWCGEHATREGDG